jgi:hypothetical protein
MISTLLDALAAELSRPRELRARVENHITGTYNVDLDSIGRFLIDTLPGLEDDEIDLALSPVFTPKLSDQAVFADLLGSRSIPREQWPGLVRQLAVRPVIAQLVSSDGRSHAVPLRDVTIERYVHRLRLDATIPEALFNRIERTGPTAGRPTLKAIARREIWERDGRRNILERYLEAAGDTGGYSLEDALELLNLIESSKPANLGDLLAAIPRRQQSLREQIDTGGGPSPFFSGQVQAMHGGERDQRGHDDARLIAKLRELEFLGRLQQLPLQDGL